MSFSTGKGVFEGDTDSAGDLNHLNWTLLSVCRISGEYIIGYKRPLSDCVAELAGFVWIFTARIPLKIHFLLIWLIYTSTCEPHILLTAVAYLCVIAVQHFLNDPHGEMNTGNFPDLVPLIR